MKTDPLKVLKTTKSFFNKTDVVCIDENIIGLAAKKVIERIEKGLPSSNAEHFSVGDKENDVQIIFLENVTNFCFWAEQGNEKWKVAFKGKEEDGASGLPLVYERALEDGFDILSPDYLSNISLEDVKKIFRPSNGIRIPLIEERHKNLVEAGRVLKKKFNGQFINLIKDSRFDAIEITKATVNSFSSFNDSYAGVNFYKRAQLNAYDVMLALGEDELSNIEKLTAMPDYKLPQILRHLGVLVYSEELAKAVDNYQLINSGSEEELAIRSGTVVAIEKICELLNMDAGLVDRAVWWISREEKIEKPYHRTYSIYY